MYYITYHNAESNALAMRQTPTRPNSYRKLLVVDRIVSAVSLDGGSGHSTIPARNIGPKQSSLHSDIGEQASSPTRKRVSFNETSRGRIGLSREEYTDDEVKSYWYRGHEYATMRGKCSQILIKAISGDNHRYCIRGLEHLVPEAAEERKTLITKANNAVLLEQDKQRLLEINDPEAIALKYQQAALKCQLMARLAALQDQLTVERMR